MKSNRVRARTIPKGLCPPAQGCPESIREQAARATHFPDRLSVSRGARHRGFLDPIWPSNRAVETHLQNRRSVAALRRRQFQLVDVKRAPTERADALYLFQSRLIMGCGTCNGTPHFGRENKLALALRRIHAAIIRTGVVLVSEVPALDLPRIRHKVKRRGQACQILLPASLVNGGKPAELAWLQHEEESLAERMLKTLPGPDC